MRNLTDNELADRWRRSPRTLQQWRWQGKGPRYLKIGGSVIYPLDHVEDNEAENTHQNTCGPVLSGANK